MWGGHLHTVALAFLYTSKKSALAQLRVQAAWASGVGAFRLKQSNPLTFPPSLIYGGRDPGQRRGVNNSSQFNRADYLKGGKVAGVGVVRV